MSDFLLNHKGALPVPTVITEPAVGYGAGLGLLFFSEPVSEAAASARASGKGPAPPNITAIGGAYTENGTWAAGLAHFHTWDGDRYRYLGAIAKVDAQLDYYGLLNQPRAYQLQGVFLVQQFLVRLGDTRWYVGPRSLRPKPAYRQGRGWWSTTIRATTSFIPAAASMPSWRRSSRAPA